MSRKQGASATQTKAGAEISEHRLKNGLRVLIARRHLDPVVAVMTWYNVGARNELADEAGVSHFLEHMMFKGSKRFAKGEVDRHTTELGGSNNAFTTCDHTAYWFEFASDRWEHALEIEADRMSNLTLDAAEFESEKQVVLEELSMGKDDPWRNLSQDVNEALYGRHPYGRPIIGYADVLERMTADDMRAYYKRFYHPGNATIVLCGDVTKSAGLRAVRKHFAGIERGMDFADADCFRPAEEEPKGERFLRVTWDDPASRLIMAWPAVSVGKDDDWNLDLVSALLTVGRTSRMHRRLVLEKGLATSIGTNNDCRVDRGSFWLYAEGAHGVALADLQAELDAELQRMADELVPAAELKRAKAMLDASEAHEGETVSDLAEDIGGFAVDADWKMAIESSARRGRVTAKAIRDTVRRLLTKERRVVGWSEPR
jgi:zinc protease